MNSSTVHKAGQPGHGQRLVVPDANELLNEVRCLSYIYLGAYEGWYDEGQEEFVTETEGKELRPLCGARSLRFSTYSLDYCR